MKVFIANIDLISPDIDKYMDMLSPRHRARALKNTDETSRAQFVLGRLMAKYSGKKHTAIAACENLVVVAAASNVRVGIDIANVNSDCEYRSDNPRINLPAPKNKKEVLRNITYTNAIYRLGTTAHWRQFMRYGDYVICVASTRRFDMPRLRKFNPDTISV